MKLDDTIRWCAEEIIKLGYDYDTLSKADKKFIDSERQILAEIMIQLKDFKECLTVIQPAVERWK